MGFTHEASILENIADLCYEKATMFTLFAQLRESPEGSDQTEHRENDSCA
jgi:hypothetical protein